MEEEELASRVRIAIVDSGVNADHPHVERVAGVIRFFMDGSRVVSDSSPNAASDPVGHGTACAGIVRWLVPDAKIFAVRILDDQLKSHIRVLCAALEFCIENDIEIVNLSLGTNEKGDADLLLPLCDALNEKGTSIVAAVRSPEEPGWPARFDSVFAVAPDPSLDVGELGFVEEGSLWLAPPFPRPRPGQPRERNFSGASFAAPYVSSLLARGEELARSAQESERTAWLRSMVSSTHRFENRALWLEQQRD